MGKTYDVVGSCQVDSRPKGSLTFGVHCKYTSCSIESRESSLVAGAGGGDLDLSDLGEELLLDEGDKHSGSFLNGDLHGRQQKKKTEVDFKVHKD